jgi:hypothetical protein
MQKPKSINSEGGSCTGTHFTREEGQEKEGKNFPKESQKELWFGEAKKQQLVSALCFVSGLRNTMKAEGWGN